MLMPPPRQYSVSQTPLQTALWSCAGSLALVFAYSSGYNLLLFAPSIYLLQIYDRVLSSRSADTLLMLTLIVALVVVIGGVLDALRRAALGRIGAWLEDCLRPALVSACFEYGYRADAVRASEAYRDLSSLRQFLESGACQTLLDVLWAPLFLGVLFLVHPLLGALGSVSVLLLFGLALVSALITEGALTRSGAALTRSYARFGTALANIHLIRAMGMLDGATRLVHKDAQDARSEHETAQRRTEIIMLISRPLRALAYVLIMGSAAWLALDQGRSPGIIFVTCLVFGRALAPIESTIAAWKAIAMASAAYQRLSSVFSAVSPVASVRAVLPSRLEGRLNLENVSVALPGSSCVLNGVSFALAPGDCLGIIGPSGSGKSTLGRVIAGISVPTAGRVLLDNTDVATLRGVRHGLNVGYLPQDIDLFGETVKDIIARLDDADPQKVIEAAKLAGLHDTIMKLPQAYDTVVSNIGPLLLRGYRQRLGLARAFFGEPGLVVLDEPNASLDFIGERVLLEAVERMKAANVTVIIITHRMGILEATTKIAIMQGGVLSDFGDSRGIIEKWMGRPLVGSSEGGHTNQERAREGETHPQPVLPCP